MVRKTPTEKRSDTWECSLVSILIILINFVFVNLDDYLSGNAVQHREVQGSESERFLSYFKSRGGVTYRQGGIASGFHRHQSTNEARLFRLKGRHTVRLFEMPSIDWSYISRGDVYLLDLNEVIFLWNGAKSNKYERLQAMQRARQLRDERGKTNIVIIVFIFLYSFFNQNNCACSFDLFSLFWFLCCLLFRQQLLMFKRSFLTLFCVLC